MPQSAGVTQEDAEHRGREGGVAWAGLNGESGSRKGAALVPFREFPHPSGYCQGIGTQPSL